MDKEPAAKQMAKRQAKLVKVRVLVVSAPMLGHIFPMIPLARALQSAGHEIVIATAGDALAARGAGLPIEDVTPLFNFQRIARRTMLRHPLIAKSELVGRAGTSGVRLLFGAVNDEMASQVGALAKRWMPHLIVYEPLAAAGALAAARLGVPAVLHENSLFDGQELVRVTVGCMKSALQRHGADSLPPNAATLSVAPPSLVGARSGWPMRYVPYSGEGVLPEWLRRRPERPRILVSRSTVRGPGGGRLMMAVVAAAPGVDAEFVLVRPDRRVLRQTALPENVRTVDWVPLTAALGTSAAVVHHGGAGTILGALVAGVPQLAVSGPGDRTHNAHLVAARGAGLATTVNGITAANLRRLLNDTALASAAEDVRQEIAAMPPPEEVVARIEAQVRPR
jgi:UDP:flavonoid glycosyltransferase YjiC (YdhE family)